MHYSTCPHQTLAFEAAPSDRTWCETCGVLLVPTDLGLDPRPVSLRKGVYLGKRKPARRHAAERVMTDAPSRARLEFRAWPGSHRRPGRGVSLVKA